MRENLIFLIKDTVILQYCLPYTEKGIDKSVHSNKEDHCYKCSDNNDLSNIIYNAIVDYSYNELDLEKYDVQVLLKRALSGEKMRPLDKPRINKNGKDNRVNYGFYGEVLLYCILYVIYKTKPIIARGYLYTTTSNSEVTGFDSYHMVDNGISLDLWFGEAKMYSSKYENAVKSIFETLDNDLSMEYLTKNFMNISGISSYVNIESEKINSVLNKWKSEGNVQSLIEEIKSQNMRLIYPILLSFENKKDYDNCIKEVIEHINTKKSNIDIDIDIDYELFFILLPIDGLKELKEKVLECIDQKQQLIF